MGDYYNPSKKPRLEDSLDAWENDFAANDDLWGHDELTAEEFDMLEIQASQASVQNDYTTNDDFCAPGPSNAFTIPEKIISANSINIESEEALLEKYALEGRVKTLLSSLEKTTKDLSGERLSREQIISARLDQFKSKEIALLEEVEVLKTSIQFKEQEVRAERTKSLALEAKLKDQTKENHSLVSQDFSAKTSFRNLTNSKKSPIKFPNRFSFEAKGQSKGVEAAAQTESLKNRKFQLPVRSPRGEIKGADMVSTLLSAKTFSTSAFDNNFLGYNAQCSTTLYYKTGACKKLPGSTISLALLSDGEELDNFWKSYETMFQDYLPFLKEQNLTHHVTPLLPKKSINGSGDDLKISSPNKSGSDCKVPAVVYYLRDIARLLFYRCPKKNAKHINISEQVGKVSWPKGELDLLSVQSCPLFESDEKMEVIEIQPGHPLIELLCVFANPNSYPAEYSKSCEIEWALLALIAWSAHSTESLERRITNLPLYSLVSGQHGMKSAYLTLKLMLPFSASKHFQKYLVHLSGCCVFCSIGGLCHSVCSSLTHHSTCLLISLVEDFLSGIFSCMGFSLLNEDTCPCSSLVFQGIISMLWQKATSDRDHFQSCCINALKKGTKLLSFLASHVKDFRARRAPIEDCYISLISTLSRLCRENVDFKQLQDIIRDLWDFQDDTNEFDPE